MSRSYFFVLGICAALGACVDKDNSKAKGGPASAPLEPSTDATAAPAPVANTIESPPPTGTHLDGTASYRPRSYQPNKQAGKTIELILRSTPPGANASIDGTLIGVTPTFWRGRADGRSHEYTFVREGYAIARYRFVATQDGVVHGSLNPLVEATVAEPAPSTNDPAAPALP